MTVTAIVNVMQERRGALWPVERNPTLALSLITELLHITPAAIESAEPVPDDYRVTFEDTDWRTVMDNYHDPRARVVFATRPAVGHVSSANWETPATME